MLSSGEADLGRDESWIIRSADAPILFYANLLCVGLSWLMAASFTVWVPLRRLSRLSRSRFLGAFHQSGRLDFSGSDGGRPKSPGWTIVAKLGAPLLFLTVAVWGATGLWGAATQRRVIEFCGRHCDAEIFVLAEEPGAFWLTVVFLAALEVAALYVLALTVLGLAWEVRDWLRRKHR